jgi:hypothetical protein
MTMLFTIKPKKYPEKIYAKDHASFADYYKIKNQQSQCCQVDCEFFD